MSNKFDLNQSFYECENVMHKNEYEKQWYMVKIEESKNTQFQWLFLENYNINT